MVPSTPVIPDKLYFRIGDVAKLCAVPAYVLRFWETEFPQLKPNKGGTGQRLYRRRDVEVALRIKSLLYEQGYTIAGARQVFAAESKAKEAAESVAPTTEISQTVPAADPRPGEMGPANPEDAGAAGIEEARRRMQLSALRDELRALAGRLAQPLAPAAAAAGDPPEPILAEAGASEPKPKTMRPRLVLEPKAEPKISARHTDQGDLFPSE
ncbi:MAG: MerR family transcriptional regulator [Acidobacteriota bacterium]